jgi:uncharacterized protein YndB with AHSA1/START domain
MGESVSGSVDIAAPAHRVYEMVSDVTRMPEWSPEQSATKWIGSTRAPEVGARFSGTNRNGVRRWTTQCKVTDARPGQRFAFRVSSFGMPVADWVYEFMPTETGCTVTESTTDRRGAVIKVAGPIVTGVRNRSEHNAEGIRQTLAALKAAAESRG